MVNFTPINCSSKVTAAEDDHNDTNSKGLKIRSTGLGVVDNPVSSKKNPSASDPKKLVPPRKSTEPKSNNKVDVHQPGKKGPDYAVPIESRRNAIQGTKDETLLRIACRRNDSELKELVFSNIPQSDIDWNNIQHIRKINCWRQQIFSRGGLKTRDIQTWHPLEEAFMRLYVLAVIKKIDYSGEPAKLPSTAVLLEDFNQVFKDVVLQDKHGKDLDPRVARTISNFSSKFCRVVGPLKKYLATKVDKDTKCEPFRPDINLKAVERFESDELSIPDPEKGTEQEWEDLLVEIRTFKRKTTGV